MTGHDRHRTDSAFQQWRLVWCAVTVCALAVSLAPAGPDEGIPILQPSKLDLIANVEEALSEYERALAVQQVDPARARRLFQSAAQRFRSVASAGIRNGYLEYNLGNAYLQAGDVGRAILHYLRAERLIPRDPFLHDNLAVARKRRLTDIPELPRARLMESIFFWHYQTTSTARAKVAAIAFILVWPLLAVYSATRRRSTLLIAAIAGVMAIAAGFSLATQRWAQRNHPEGVVLSMDVAVYKGPGEGYGRQFEEPLQPGLEFTLDQTRGDWWRIRLPDQTTGWLHSDHAELVSPRGGP